MTFEDVLERLRSWCGDLVVVVLEPDHSVMPGVLCEIDAAGIDGALFAVADEARPGRRTSAIAVALFRDAFASAQATAEDLRVRQGRVEIIVRRRHRTGTEAPSPAH